MRYFFGFLVTIGLVILVIILLVSGGGSKQPATKVDLRQYANSDARAQLIVDGPIVSDQEHQQVEIDVDRNQVAYTLYTGYQRTIKTTKSYTNNNNAFNNFLYGLYQANYANGNTDKSLRDNRGYCVEGERYNFSFDDSTKNVLYLWHTSCGQGTYKGNFAATLYLFKNQVPDLDTLTNEVNFGF